MNNIKMLCDRGSNRSILGRFRMNKNQMKQVMKHYIDNFAMINDTDHAEYYKWQICEEFRGLMDEALAADLDHFPDALLSAKTCSSNIIDSYTQPFYGLCKLAKENGEAEAVQQMFRELYTDDHGDIQVQMELIKNFFDASNNLLNKYYPDSYLFKQNSHSVSSYLFLYDPDHHYMYKATQSLAMADCIEFYDSWGNGDNIKLDIYYRMCNEILTEIKNSPELLETNKSRYEEALPLRPGKLHPDAELHILVFDLIYCSNVYHLFDGISFLRPKAKEKKLIIEQKAKAKKYLEAYNVMKANSDKLERGLVYFSTAISAGDMVHHKMQGMCEVIDIDKKYIIVKYGKTGETKQLGLPIVISNGIINYQADGFEEKKKFYSDVLPKAAAIPAKLEHATRTLEPFEEYLE